MSCCCFTGIFKSSSSTRRCGVYDDITQTIGQTPIVKVNKNVPNGCTLYVKLEYFNPLKSVKDRLAIAIIEDGETKGLLRAGSTIIEATSGNTGFALAMACAQRGYVFVACMPDSFSVERRKVMRALGAKVILTPPRLGVSGAVMKAEELAETHGWYLARQFETECGADVHQRTTGPEIVYAFAGKRLDYWVTGYGTGGTYTGVGKAIKELRPDVKIILSEPKDAPLVSSGVKQRRKEVLGVYGAPASAHPHYSSHPIQGWTPSFIPYVCEMGLNLNLHDEIILVDGKDAMATALDLARNEGIFCGTSGGATVWSALEVCRRAPYGSTVLAMVPDTAERYLNTSLFAEITADMDADERAIALSTPTGIESLS